MYPTRLLRRVIHYIWECFQINAEMKMRLKNYKGDELHIEESSAELQVTVRYFAKQPTGEVLQQLEVVCFILRHGEWIPLVLRTDGTTAVYGTSDPETGQVTVTDQEGQAKAVGLCDAWALWLLEGGFPCICCETQSLDGRTDAPLTMAGTDH
jgi:hypothetical protein